MRRRADGTSLSFRTEVVLLALVAALIIGMRLIGGDGHAWASVINDDGKCYYEYLRALFITGDRSHEGITSWFLSDAGEHQVIKCFSGTAVLQLPFFLLAHVRSLFAHGPEDGYSLHYQLAIAAAGLFYFAIGLHATRKLLVGCQLPDRAIAIALVIITLGTGLVYYAVWSPAMSHVYAFAMVAVFLRSVQVIESRTALAFARSGLLLGLVALVRPVDVLVVLAIPMIRIQPLRMALRDALIPAVVAAASFLAVVCVQPLLWYAQSGTAWVGPYSGEGFIWDRPRMWATLLGARKGLFFYWPLLVLIVPGLLQLARQHRRAAFAGAVHFLLLAYITGAWWSWYYGSYGMRPYLDHLAVFAIPVAACFLPLSARSLRIALWPIVALIALQCFQAWQFSVGIITSGDMDMEKYRTVFLRSDAKFRFVSGGALEEPPYAPNGLVMVADHVFDDVDVHPNSTTWIPFFSEIPNALRGQRLFIQVSLRRHDDTPGASNDARFITTLDRNGEFLAEENFLLNGSPDVAPSRHWRYAFHMPPAHERTLRFRIGHPGTGSFRLEDARITVSAVRPGK